jgi:hypothetical protein
MATEEYSRGLLKLARTMSGLSQAELAEKAGTSQPAISAIESGKISPTVDTLVRLVEACGLELRAGLDQPDTHDSSRLAFQKMIDPAHIAEHERQQQLRLDQLKRDRRNKQRRERRAAVAGKRDSSTRSNP